MRNHLGKSRLLKVWTSKLFTVRTLFLWWRMPMMESSSLWGAVSLSTQMTLRWRCLVIPKQKSSGTTWKTLSRRKNTNGCGRSWWHDCMEKLHLIDILLRSSQKVKKSTCRVHRFQNNLEWWAGVTHYYSQCGAVPRNPGCPDANENPFSNVGRKACGGRVAGFIPLQSWCGFAPFGQQPIWRSCTIFDSRGVLW